jgi:hypothetical protein
MSSNLDALCGPSGPLQKEPPDAKEFAGLVASGERRLRDAERKENALESRFDLAYNAAHSLSLAALRRAGYRSSHRYVVFQALEHTLGLGPGVWRVLDRAHKERNSSEYEGALNVDERLLGDVIAACRAVLAALRKLPPL